MPANFGHSRPARANSLLAAATAACLVGTSFAAAATRPVSTYVGEHIVFWDDFSSLDLSHRWKPEISLSGYGSWSFEEYRNNRSNLFVRDGALHLKPMLNDYIPEAQLRNGYTHDIRGTDPANSCTADQYWGCMRTSGAGGNILNPVSSARIRTAETFNFKYGRVEVRAKLPVGDWLWPAIWLLPRWQQYGPWPASGEIDIMESRGNGAAYVPGGIKSFGSTLHAGPYTTANLYETMHAEYTHPTPLSDDFHIYGLLWTPSGIKTYIDSPDNIVLNTPFTNDMFTRGGFSAATTTNPWTGGPTNAPFDQEFYLIMNVAVGGVGGFFPDGFGKPWANLSPTAITDFWNAKDTWYPTWQAAGDNSAMQVDWVRVYQFDDTTIDSSVSGDFFLRATADGLLSMPTPRPQEIGAASLAAMGLRATVVDDLLVRGMVSDPCLNTNEGQTVQVQLKLNVTRSSDGGVDSVTLV